MILCHRNRVAQPAGDLVNGAATTGEDAGEGVSPKADCHSAVSQRGAYGQV